MNGDELDEAPRYLVDRKDRRRYGNGFTPGEAWMNAALRHAAATRACAASVRAIDDVDDRHDVSIDRKASDCRIVVAGGALAASVAAPAASLELFLPGIVAASFIPSADVGRLAIVTWLAAAFAVLLWLTNRVYVRFEGGRLRVRERWFPWRARSYAAADVLRVEEVRFERDAWSLALQVRRGDAPPRWVLVRTKLRRHAEARELVEAIRGILEPAAESTAYRSALPSRDLLRNETEPRPLEARHTS
ncbi:MAG: hypothetical protein NVSMB47_13530 [Polyangiales bacterium]